MYGVSFYMMLPVEGGAVECVSSSRSLAQNANSVTIRPQRIRKMILIALNWRSSAVSATAKQHIGKPDNCGLWRWGHYSWKRRMKIWRVQHWSLNRAVQALFLFFEKPFSNWSGYVGRDVVKLWITRLQRSWPALLWGSSSGVLTSE